MRSGPKKGGLEEDMDLPAEDDEQGTEGRRVTDLPPEDEEQGTGRRFFSGYSCSVAADKRPGMRRRRSGLFTYDHVRRSSVGVMIRIFIIWKREIEI